MTVTAVRSNTMWARNFSGQHSFSVTVQVPGVAAFCEVALHSTWAVFETFHAADAFITQIVSASGVEEFPTENTTAGNLTAQIFRNQVTSVTFKLSVFNEKAHSRWIVYDWA